MMKTKFYKNTFGKFIYIVQSQQNKYRKLHLINISYNSDLWEIQNFPYSIKTYW